MTRTLLTLTCMFYLLNSTFSQTVMNERDSLKAYYSKKNKITNDGMYVLGGWATLNLVMGIIGSVNSEGTHQYFYQMNAFWGGVNLLISYTSLRALHKTANDPVFIGYAELDQRKTEKIFLINAGLDVLYIGAGFGLIDWSGSRGVNEQRIEGYGQSFVVQGAFLLGFDLIMYYLHKRNKKQRLNPLLKGLEFNGVGLTYRFD